MNISRRQIGEFSIAAIGLGCMNLSHAYGTPPSEQEASALLRHAYESGVDFFDTAALYGFGSNETLLGKALKPFRQHITLASKCGMTGVDGKRVIDGRPKTLKRTCDEALQRLQTEVIDLYYLHRRDFAVPIEDSVGALADLVKAGKIRAIGLSEVSAKTLRAAHAVHPIAAMQSEYSLWTREPEIDVLAACQELGTAFVAFSPLARGFLTGALRNPAIELSEKDIRRAMPRFASENYQKNMVLLAGFQGLADEVGCTPAQLALAWLLNRSPNIIPIPGTRSQSHFDENLWASQIVLPADVISQLDRLINHRSVHGARYNAATQTEIDSEKFVD